jgi:hypothetical protein
VTGDGRTCDHARALRGDLNDGMTADDDFPHEFLGGWRRSAVESKSILESVPRVTGGYQV